MGRKAYETFACSCGERCVMVPHEKSGKLAPITTARYDGGNIVLCFVFVDGMPTEVYRIAPKAEREEIPGARHVNHWSTCPHAASFRR